MMIAAAGAGGNMSLSPMAGAGAAQQATGAEQAGGREQVSEVIGDRSASSGQGVQSRSVDVLSDGTIRDMVFLYLTEDGNKTDKSKDGGEKNLAAMAFAKELYDAASQLQATNAQGATGGDLGGGMSGGMGGGAGGGLGGGAGGGGIIAR